MEVIHSNGMGGGKRGRGGGDICDVLPLSADFSGLSSGGVLGEGPHVRQDT